MKKIFLHSFFTLLSVSAAFAQKGFGVICVGADYSTKNSFAANCGVILPATERYYIRVNTIALNAVKHDEYNPDTSSISMLPLYNVIPLGALGIARIALTGSTEEAPKDKKWVDKIITPLVLPLMVTQVLINSEHHYILTADSAMRSRKISAFLRTQLDYFDNQPVKWLRYKPALGLEFTIGKENFFISASVAVEKPMDYARKEFFYHPLRPNFGFTMASNF